MRLRRVASLALGFAFVSYLSTHPTKTRFSQLGLKRFFNRHRAQLRPFPRVDPRPPSRPKLANVEIPSAHTKSQPFPSTMVFPLAAAVTRRRVGMIAKQQVQKRSMGGHAPAPEWTGIDKVVRGVFPHDHQRA